MVTIFHKINLFLFKIYCASVFVTQLILKLSKLAEKK